MTEIHTRCALACCSQAGRCIYPKDCEVDATQAADRASRDTGAATHRHKKRGSEYVLVGYGRMQAGFWYTPLFPTGEPVPIDMREVAIYRSTHDGSLWARPREEFEDGRFEVLEPTPAAPQPEAVAALKEADFWLEGALQCKEWHWDDDQREAAELSRTRIRAALGEKADV